MTCTDKREGARIRLFEFAKNKEERRRIVNFTKEIGIFFIPERDDSAAKLVQPLQLLVSKIITGGVMKNVGGKLFIDAGNGDQRTCRSVEDFIRCFEVRNEGANFLRTDTWHGRKPEKFSDIDHIQINIVSGYVL